MQGVPKLSNQRSSGVDICMEKGPARETAKEDRLA
jgi:hypothetical protein